MNKILSSCIAMLGAAGLFGASSADAQSFRNVSDAKAYLAANPTGPRAGQAFRVIADATLSTKYPEFSRRTLAGGIASSVAPGPDASRAAIRRALAAVSGSGSASTAAPPPRGPSGPDNSEPVY